MTVDQLELPGIAGPPSVEHDGGLTSSEKYGKTHISRVTAIEQNDRSVSESILKADEVCVLPREAHEGPCFISLSRGLLTGACICLAEFI